MEAPVRAVAVALAVSVALAWLAACDAQVGVGYRGEPLAQLQGTVVLTNPPTESLDAALIWLPSGAATDSAMTVVTQIPVEKTFPAHFVMTLFLPPPAEVLTAGVVWHAEAHLAAVRHGDGTVYGTLDEPLIHFFSGDVPLASLLGRRYGALHSGYHLIRRTPIADPAQVTPAQVDACVADLAAAGLAASGDPAATQLCHDELILFREDDLPLETSLVLTVAGP
jgi:hypothetical protein